MHCATVASWAKAKVEKRLAIKRKVIRFIFGLLESPQRLSTRKQPRCLASGFVLDLEAEAGL
jgi:hypothetical protein